MMTQVNFFLFVAWLTTAASKPIIIMSCYNWAFFYGRFFPHVNWSEDRNLQILFEKIDFCRIKKRF